MSSKIKSRWADDDEDAALDAQRKREKEAKKLAKAEKARIAEEAAAAQLLKQQQTQAQQQVIEHHSPLSSRPSKRRKLSPPPEAQPERETLPPAKLLRFPAPSWKKCRSVEDYEKLNDIEEGAYGWVSRAKDMVTGKVVALKRLKMENANDGVPVTGLREIQTLMACSHPNIVALQEVVVGEDTSKIEKYALPSLSPKSKYISKFKSKSTQYILIEGKQYFPSPRLPRTRPKNPPRNHARTLPNLRSQDPPPAAHLRRLLSPRKLHPPPGPQNLQPAPLQPGRPKNCRLRNGTFRRPRTETHILSSNPLVPLPRAPPRYRNIWGGSRYLVPRLYIRRTSLLDPFVAGNK